MVKSLETQKQIKELGERIAALEEKIKDGKTYVVTDSAYDIDDIAEIVAKRLNVETLIKNEVRSCPEGKQHRRNVQSRAGKKRRR